MTAHDLLLDAEGPSWLTLEQYALGELDAVAAREVERQLAASPHAREMLAAIRADDTVLPALPVPLRPRRRALWLGASSALVAAAALLLRAPEQGHEAALASTRHFGTKGEQVAITLFSELTGSDPRSFGEGERFKLFFSCPPALRQPPRVLVFQGGVRYEPLARQEPPACGNQQPWPGAFSLTGKQPAEVCVAWGSDAAHAASARQLGDQAVCLTLTPAR